MPPPRGLVPSLDHSGICRLVGGSHSLTNVHTFCNQGGCCQGDVVGIACGRGTNNQGEAARGLPGGEGIGAGRWEREAGGCRRRHGPSVEQGEGQLGQRTEGASQPWGPPRRGVTPGELESATVALQ